MSLSTNANTITLVYDSFCGKAIELYFYCVLQYLLIRNLFSNFLITSGILNIYSVCKNKTEIKNVAYKLYFLYVIEVFP